MNQELSMSPNLLVAALQKPASEFTKADIISYIKVSSVVNDKIQCFQSTV